MKNKKWLAPREQMCVIGKHSWSVPKLFELARELPVMEIPLEHLYTWYQYENVALRDMVMHMEAVLKVDMSLPIILDEDGIVMDGRHRIMRAMIDNRKTIKAVRFEENPTPCKWEE